MSEEYPDSPSAAGRATGTAEEGILEFNDNEAYNGLRSSSAFIH